jgi:hypothetical protein
MITRIKILYRPILILDNYSIFIKWNSMPENKEPIIDMPDNSGMEA